MPNPFTHAEALPHGAIPFDRVSPDDFAPALESAITQAKGALAAIAGLDDPATFGNTIPALEDARLPVMGVRRAFETLRSSVGTDAIQDLAPAFMKSFGAFENDVHLDEALFARVEAVYQGRGDAALDPEQVRVVEKIRAGFVRGGARLAPSGRERLRAIDAELAELSSSYSKNVLDATNAFRMVIEDEAELEGLPATVIDEAAHRARAAGLESGWAFTLQRSSLKPFVTHSCNRERRREIVEANSRRAVEGPFDNRANAKRIAVLRHERARLLGYETHAHFVLERRMAKDPETVANFLEGIIDAGRQALEAEVLDLRRRLRADTGHEDLRAWDLGHYRNQRLQDELSFDDEALRPYFALANCVTGVKELARKLFGLVFERAQGVPAFHPSVEILEARVEATGEFMGLLYLDLFERATKRPGAWSGAIREQGLEHGELVRPHVTVTCNYAEPRGDTDTLLSLEEVRTLFHEFGHALHALLSRCTYRSLSGPKVLWDFVELPSQIMENWVYHPEGLDLFARHVETGEPMPREWVEKVAAARSVGAAAGLFRQVNLGLLDMAWFTADPSGIEDLEAFETEATAAATFLPPVPGAVFSCAFGHIFAGGYSAGYYSYEWARMLEADAFELFEERGVFDRETADRFRAEILERGDTADPAELYRRFRGRDPDPRASLRKVGIV